MFKNSTVEVGGRWLLTAVYFGCALLPGPLILLALPTLSRPLQAVIAGMCLLWLIPLYYCAMQGQHWARLVTSLLLLGAILVVCAVWVPETTLLSVTLALFAGALAAALTFVKSLRSPLP